MGDTGVLRRTVRDGRQPVNVGVIGKVSAIIDNIPYVVTSVTVALCVPYIWLRYLG